MNLLFFCTKFPPSLGGMQESNYEIVKASQELGHEILVQTIETKRDDESFDVEQDFIIKRVKNSESAFDHNLFKRGTLFFRIYLKIRERIKYWEPDRLIVADSFSRYILGMFPKPGTVETIVITSVPPGVKKEQKSFLLSELRKKITLNCYKKADQTLFVSNSTRKYLYKKYEKKIFKGKGNNVVYRTLDDSFIQNDPSYKKIRLLKEKHDIVDTQKIILSVSRIKKVKGIDSVLKCLKKLVQDNNFDQELHYLVVGDGDYLGDLKDMAKKLRIKDKVTFVGEVEHKKTVHYYDICDIFILPSRLGVGESFGRIFAEASARGKPVIGNSAGGVKEVVKDKKTGLLVDPEDLEDIYEKLKLLLENRTLRDKLGKKGEKYVRNNFTKRQLKTRLKYILAKEARNR